ncbi:MAG: DNA-binding protein WhiA [Epulopiscium sp. Nele67-Bin005]|nr:MAG: DNA-binding protein WhiA [Epulopiscium sp. Nele67-Bin005]
MSFSTDVKQELVKDLSNDINCITSELAGFFISIGNIAQNDVFFTVELPIENEDLAKKYFTMIQKAFNINSEVILENFIGRKKYNHVLKITSPITSISIINQLKLLQDVQINYELYSNFDSICCRRAFLRGAFLAVGSVNDPHKGYHLEFIPPTVEQAKTLQAIMKKFDIDSKIIKRKNHNVVYLKEGSQIVDLLNIMGAHVALMNFENVRIVKEVRNNVNRLVNCETANLKKTISASVRQIQDIEYLKNTIGLDSLAPQLEIVANYRIAYPSATLKELGEMMTPPIGKSGINHRLKKISSFANQTRKLKGEVNYDNENDYFTT